MIGQEGQAAENSGQHSVSPAPGSASREAESGWTDPRPSSSAVISDDGTYRYRLTRTWEPDAPELAWIMLNPSTADAEQDDPTIRRCISFAKSWGYGGIVVVNLFAARCTDPAGLCSFIDPIGPENEAYLRLETQFRTVVAAWGASVPHYWRHRPRAVLTQLQDRAVHHLGLTKDGHPRHPLYVKGDTPPTLWNDR